MDNPIVWGVVCALVTAGAVWLVGWDRRGPAAVEHEGATEAYADELAALVAAAAVTVEIPTIAELVADAAVIVEKQHRAEEAEEERICAGVHAELAAIDDAVIRFRIGMGRLEAGWARYPEERTELIDRVALLAMLDDDGLVPA